MKKSTALLLLMTMLTPCLSACGGLFRKTTSLDGKKIIFIGDSFVYFGQTVLEVTQKFLDEEYRVNDEGYFYQICKANGMDVSVTNWTLGGHGIGGHLAEVCQLDRPCKGENHLSYLKDRNYDYVVLSGGRRSDMTEEEFLGDVQALMNIFKAENPNTKFVYLVSSGAHNVSVKETFPVNVLNNLTTIEEWGFTIVDWGKLVRDIIDGQAVVDGDLDRSYYNKFAFTISKTSDDGFHPSQLSGYITSLMTYCALTGESAVGQPYDFVFNTNASLHASYRSPAEFLKKYYGHSGGLSTYPEIFESEKDMRAIQKLIDEYLERKDYKSYDF